MNPRWPIAVRAATSTAIPVLVGSATSQVGAGLIATLGAFTSRFGGDRPYRNRSVQLAAVSLALAGTVAAGSWAARLPWLGVAVVSVVAVAAVWLCNALLVGPPGAYVFALACAAQLRELATALRAGAAAPEITAAPDALAKDVAALLTAIGTARAG